MINRMVSHYRIIRKLGGGGMGVVYEAEDTRLSRSVALKFLPERLATDRNALTRFQREARAASSLNHPNICAVYALDDYRERPFIVMELVEGKTLSELMQEGPLTFREILDLSVQVVRALATAHTQGIIHRDIKPANIMVQDDGRVKVLDFGLAKLKAIAPAVSEDEAPTKELSLEGVLFGTLTYMSPEQLRGQPADRRSDIFSFGVVLYELLTGKPPFVGASPAEIASSILRDEADPLTNMRRDLPLSLGRLVESCLEKDLNNRPRSMEELHDRLDAIKKAGRSESVKFSPSVAILPFLDPGGTGAQDHLCEGIAAEIINYLAGVKGLWVAPRTSSFSYRDPDLDAQEIGSLLEVETVAVGTLQRLEGRLSVSARLMRVSDGTQLWSRAYERGIEDIFAVQEDIAGSIAKVLREVRETMGSDTLNQASTRSIEAYDYYLRGRRFLYQFGKSSVEKALKMFHLAVKHDSEYALAYAGIADCHCFLLLYESGKPEDLERADWASLKALKLDPQLAEAHLSRAQFLSLTGKHPQAELQFRTAIELGRKLFEAYYFFARDCFAQGKLKQASELFEQASRVFPEDYQSPLLVAQIYCDLGLHDKAEASRRRGIQIVEQRLKQYPGDVRALYMGANGLVSLGEVERALEWAELALTMEPTEPMVLYNVACVYALAGRRSDALDCLEKAVESGLKQKGWLENDNNLDSLRGKRRFKEILELLDD